MARHPNLVFIMSDQQRYDTMACYGNDWIDTPNLNALASESFVFERAYVTQPVCTPARASIMTGLYPHSAGPIVNKMHLPGPLQDHRGARLAGLRARLHGQVAPGQRRAPAARLRHLDQH